MNRQQRRAAERARRRTDDDLIIAPSKAILVQLLTAMAAEDPTISGATIINPDGEIIYLDAAALRRGGNA
jgi:hypothetical protein